MNLSALGIWRIHAAGALVAACVVGAAIGLIVRPRLQAGAQARLAVETLATSRQSAEQARVRADDAEKLAARLQAEVEANPISLQSPAKLNERVVGQISARAEHLGLRVLELVPGTEIDGGTHLRFPIRLRAVGPASAGPELLAELHKVFPDLAVVGLTIRANPADAAEAAGRAQAHLSIDFEWYANSGRAAAPTK